MTKEEQISENILSAFKSLKKPMSITELNQVTKINRHTLSRHLDRLFLMGKLDMRQHGQKKKYFIPDVVTESRLLNTSPHILLILHTDYSIKWANESFLKHVGMSLKDIIGVKIYTLKFGFFNDELKNRLQELQKGGSSFFELYSEIGEEIRIFMITLAYISVIELKPIIVVACEDITERKKLEQVIHESEENLRIIAHTVNDIIIKQSIEGIISYISPACVKLTGFYPEELIGDNVFSHIHPTDLPNFERTNWVLEENESSEYISFRFMIRNGTYRWFECTNSPLLTDNEGGVHEYISVWRDISERKESETLIRESEEKFREIFNNAIDCMVIFSLDLKYRPGRIIDVNNSLCELLDIPKKELLDKLVYTIFSPNDIKKLPKMLENISNKTEVKIEINLIKKSDEFIPFEIIFHFFYIYNQKVGLLIGRDIRERKSIHESLLESHEQINNILEFFINPAFVIDINKNVTFWNKGMEKITKTPKKEILGKGNYEYSNLIYQEKVPTLVDYIFDRNSVTLSRYRNIIFHENSVSGEIQIKSSKSGKNIWYNVKASPLYNKKGALIGAIESLEDITKRKDEEKGIARESHILSIINNEYFNFVTNGIHFLSSEQIFQKICLAADIQRISIIKKSKTKGIQSKILYYDGWNEKSIQSLNNDKSFLKYIEKQQKDSVFTKVLADGISVCGSATEFSPEDHTFLKKKGILSLAIFPFLRDSDIIGFISFEDCKKKRKWDEGEYRALSAFTDFFLAIYFNS